MPRTPDRTPGPSDEEEIVLEEQGSDPTATGAIRYVGGAFRLRDAAGVFDPRTGGSGISEAQHEALDSLVHDLAEDSFVEVVRSSGRVTSIVVWTSPAKTTKIRETTITRASGQVSQVVERQYNGAGALVQTLTHDFSRTGGQIDSVETEET